MSTLAPSGSAVVNVAISYSLYRDEFFKMSRRGKIVGGRITD
jgi:hypothetical protein